MKKVFILIALLFTVVCFAAPPPDEVPVYQPDQVQMVIQDNAVIVSPVVIDVQEVTFTYIGNFEPFTSTEQYLEPVYEICLPEMLVMYESYDRLNELQKPPSLLTNVGILNNNNEFQRNMQHTNYGYPFTGDRC